jgi:hypothetical protein
MGDFDPPAALGLERTELVLQHTRPLVIVQVRRVLDAVFTGIESRVVPLTIRFASVTELVTFQREMSGTLKRALETAPPDVQERTWGVFAKAAEPYVGADGVVRFENRCRLAVGVA